MNTPIFKELAAAIPTMTTDAIGAQLRCMTKAELLNFGAAVWGVKLTKSWGNAKMIETLLAAHAATVEFTATPDAATVATQDAAEMTDEIAEAATWETSRGCDNCGADCRNLSPVNTTGDHYYTICEVCGDKQTYMKPLAVGDTVRINGTATTGVVVKRYAVKVAVEIDGVAREFYPGELRVAAATVATPEPTAAPLTVDEARVNVERAKASGNTEAVRRAKLALKAAQERERRARIKAAQDAPTPVAEPAKEAQRSCAHVADDLFADAADAADDATPTADADGYIRRRKNRATGATMAFGEAAAVGLDATGGKWVAVCLTHGAIVNAPTRRAAKYVMAAADFCEECQKVIAAKNAAVAA